MTNFRLSPTALATAAILWAQPGLAGPCTVEIDKAQAQVDSRIEAVAGSGAMGKQTNAAQMHRQPTPGSVASAEQKLGEGQGLEPALAALDRARKADAANDKAGCESALVEAKRLVGP